MNRKEFRRSFLMLIFSAILIVFLWFIFYTGYRWFKDFFDRTFSPKAVYIEQSSVYSNKLRDKVDRFIRSEMIDTKKVVLNKYEFYKELKKNFKFVKGVRWRLDSPSHSSVKIEGVNPEFLINDKFVLGNKKRLFPKENFEEFNLDSLKKISIHDGFISEKIDPKIYKSLLKIPNKYFEDYDIFCNGINCMVLSKKEDVLKRIFLVDRKLLLNCFEEKFKSIDLLADDFISRKNLDKKLFKKKRLVFDMRFNNLVCVKVV